MTWGLVNNNRIFIFGRTIPLNSHNVWYRKQTLRFTQTVCLSTTKCKQFESTCWWKAEHRTHWLKFQGRMKALSVDTSVPTPTMNLDSENGCYRLSAVTMFKMPDPSPA